MGAAGVVNIVGKDRISRAELGRQLAARWPSTPG